MRKLFSRHLRARCLKLRYLCVKKEYLELAITAQSVSTYSQCPGWSWFMCRVTGLQPGHRQVLPRRAAVDLSGRPAASPSLGIDLSRRRRRRRGWWPASCAAPLRCGTAPIKRPGWAAVENAWQGRSAASEPSGCAEDSRSRAHSESSENRAQNTGDGRRRQSHTEIAAQRNR